MCLFIVAITGCKKKPVPVFNEDETEDSTLVEGGSSVNNLSYDEMNGEIISVPFREENGVKYVPVKVNGLGFEMIFDTGCSMATISIAEAEYLYKKGVLTENDIKGTALSQNADGVISENMTVVLHEVIIGDRIFCGDVEAIVSNNNNAPLLLGNEILDRAAAFSVDNQNKVINFKLR